MKPRKDFAYSTWIIDVERSTIPGRLCFCPVLPDEENHEGVVSQITFFGEHPPVADAEIIGLMTSDSALDLDAWWAVQKPYLDRLNIRGPE